MAQVSEASFKRQTLLLLGLTAACTATEGGPTKPQLLGQLRIVPESATISIGGTLQFQALLRNGAPAAVTWAVEEPTAGTISESGLFISGLCPAVGTAHIRAQLQADAQQTATASLSLSDSRPPFVSIFSISQVPSGASASIDSLTGIVDVHLS